MTNNAAERAIRPLALGRKNYLFAGSDAGGRRATILYTLIQTATLNGLDPEAYLRDVLARIADHPINRIDRSISSCPGIGPARTVLLPPPDQRPFIPHRRGHWRTPTK
jgi:transposase